MSDLKTKLETSNSEACVCLNLRKASRAITQYYDSVLQPSGLRITQFSILIAAARAGSIPISKLANHMVINRTTLTRNLKPLQKQGLLEISTGRDLRTRFITLTSKGETVLQKALPAWQTAQQRCVKSLGIDVFRSLLRNVSEVINIAQENQLSA